jgi:cyclohexanone monooxygenase
VSEEERQRIFEERWEAGGIPFMASFNDLILDRAANETAAEFVRAKIRSIVKDPAKADLLTPRGHPIGAKRLCVDTDYYDTFNRDHVSLIDLRSTPIKTITPDGLDTTTASYALDSIVFATGFDAMTGALLGMEITGRGGQTLRATWADGPRSYLGLMVAGFPNLFTITGPGSPSVLSNMIVSIEQHVGWIRDCLAHLRAQGIGTIEATAEAEQGWIEHTREVGERTLYPQANSWYVGANIPGKPRIFMPYIGGVPVYRRTCDRIAANGYEGFALQPAREAVAAE